MWRLIEILFTIILFTSCNHHNENAVSINKQSDWSWPDSLDALVAAADYHKLLFEDSSLRILEVVVPPGKLDPIHTHAGESIVWITEASPIVYNTYDYDAKKNLRIVKKDTLLFKPHELNKGMREKPEPPHSVENIGKDTFRLYRIEYKNKM